MIKSMFKSVYSVYREKNRHNLNRRPFIIRKLKFNIISLPYSFRGLKIMIQNMIHYQKLFVRLVTQTCVTYEMVSTWKNMFPALVIEDCIIL